MDLQHQTSTACQIQPVWALLHILCCPYMPWRQHDQDCQPVWYRCEVQWHYGGRLHQPLLWYPRDTSIFFSQPVLPLCHEHLWFIRFHITTLDNSPFLCIHIYQNIFYLSLAPCIFCVCYLFSCVILFSFRYTLY